MLLWTRYPWEHGAQVWAGFLANNAVLPVCATYTFLAPHVDWSGSRYWKRRGRVVRVQRRKQ